MKSLILLALFLFITACGTIQGAGIRGYTYSCTPVADTNNSLCRAEDPSGNFVDVIVPNDGVAGFLRGNDGE